MHHGELGRLGHPVVAEVELDGGKTLGIKREIVVRVCPVRVEGADPFCVAIP